MNLKHQTMRAWLWIQKHWIVSTLAFLVGSCAFMLRDRTVTWEEAVLLNTGETILVKRSGIYSLQLQAGSPFDVRLSPEPVSTIDFTYKGKRYMHTDEITLVLLAISPEGKPTLVGSARSTDWQWKHGYFCTTPSYVQFQFDERASTWVWPTQIEKWLYGLPTNITVGTSDLANDGKRFTEMQIAEKNFSRFAGDDLYKGISETYTDSSCKKGAK